jgi:transcriptional regulator with XRE-family HTH domain
MDLYQALGAHIRHHRRAMELSQEQLAERVGVPAEIIGKIERGTTTSSFDTVEKIATALILPPLALFGRTIDETRSSERAKLLGRITTILSELDEVQMARVTKMLEALVGKD